MAMADSAIQIFDAVFVQRRTCAIIVCAYISGLKSIWSTWRSGASQAAPWPLQSGVELLDPEVREPLTRAGVLAHARASGQVSSNGGSGRRASLLRRHAASHSGAAEASGSPHKDMPAVSAQARTSTGGSDASELPNRHVDTECALGAKHFDNPQAAGASTIAPHRSRGRAPLIRRHARAPQAEVTQKETNQATAGAFAAAAAILFGAFICLGRGSFRCQVGFERAEDLSAYVF
mmetsp:Transcript_113209/g.320432  ORF Transcript_113209/g.320432 Transcript_113209/m.320432 type:complete len:234 (-) Transcript_113209:130-831(-)